MVQRLLVGGGGQRLGWAQQPGGAEGVGQLACSGCSGGGGCGGEVHADSLGCRLRARGGGIGPGGAAGWHGWAAQGLFGVLPVLAAFGAVVGLGDGHAHVVRTQAGADALDEDVPGVAARLVFRQKTGGFGLPGRGVDGAQAQAARGRQHGSAGQPLGQQALQVGHGLHGLGGAQQHRLLGRQFLPVQAALVEAPGQLQRAHALVARGQPVLQGFQQAPCRPEQRWGGVGALGQLDGLLKRVGRGDPGEAVGRAPQGHVQRPPQGRAKAPRQPGARQRGQIAPAAAAQLPQHGQVRARGAEGVQGQIGGARGRVRRGGRPAGRAPF